MSSLSAAQRLHDHHTEQHRHTHIFISIYMYICIKRDRRTVRRMSFMLCARTHGRVFFRVFVCLYGLYYSMRSRVGLGCALVRATAAHASDCKSLRAMFRQWVQTHKHTHTHHNVHIDGRVFLAPARECLVSYIDFLFVVCMCNARTCRIIMCIWCACVERVHESLQPVSLWLFVCVCMWKFPSH